MRSITLTALAATLVLIAAGCSAPAAAPAPEAPASSSAPAAELRTADSSLGTIVVDSKGLSAYYFTKDTADSGKSACSGECLQAWPPITTTSDTPFVEGVTGKVGTISLTDGSKQITVNGMPIYLFAKDTAPGDVKGQGVNKVWYVLGPDGTMITKAATS